MIAAVELDSSYLLRKGDDFCPGCISWFQKPVSNLDSHGPPGAEDVLGHSRAHCYPRRAALRGQTLDSAGNKILRPIK